MSDMLLLMMKWLLMMLRMLLLPMAQMQLIQ
jgi:hypothetical protein